MNGYTIKPTAMSQTELDPFTTNFGSHLSYKAGFLMNQQMDRPTERHTDSCPINSLFYSLFSALHLLKLMQTLS